VALLIAFGLFAAVALLFTGLAMPSAANPVQARLAQYGSRMRTLEAIELAKPFSDRALRPLLQSMARFVLRFAPKANLEKVRRQLDMSGNPYNWTPSDFLGVRGLSAIVSGAIPLALMLLGHAPFVNLILFSAGGGTLGFMLPVLWLGKKIGARQKEIQQTLPDALDVLTISVEAGLSLDGGMAKVSEKMDNELSRAFARVTSDIRVGRPRREALRDMADRAGVSDLTNFVTALIQAEQLGVSMTKILRIQSEQMRIKRRQRAEEEAHKAPVKMSVVLVLLLVPGLFIVILGPAIPRICRQFNVSALCK
jgi:tight adherence protein C